MAGFSLVQARHLWRAPPVALVDGVEMNRCSVVVMCGCPRPPCICHVSHTPVAVRWRRNCVSGQLLRMWTRCTFCVDVDYVYKKARERLFPLIKFKCFDVSQHILEMVYRGLIESILSFDIVTWYGSVTTKNKTRLVRTVDMANKLIGRDQRQLSSLYNAALKIKAITVFNDSDHPLNPAFQKGA